jgi:hypothetical protein
MVPIMDQLAAIVQQMNGGARKTSCVACSQQASALCSTHNVSLLQLSAHKGLLAKIVCLLSENVRYHDV